MHSIEHLSKTPCQGTPLETVGSFFDGAFELALRIHARRTKLSAVSWELDNAILDMKRGEPGSHTRLAKAIAIARKVDPAERDTVLAALHEAEDALNRLEPNKAAHQIVQVAIATAGGD